MTINVIERLAVKKLASDSDFPNGEELFTADNPHLVSIIVTNTTGVNGECTIYVVPDGETDEDNYGIITYELTIPPHNVYETFRFAINNLDVIYAAGSLGLSYYVQGIDESVPV